MSPLSLSESLSLSLSPLSLRSLLRTGENFRRKPPPTVYLQTTFPVRACLGRSLSASCQDESLGRLPVFLSSSETTFAIGRSSARQSRVGTQDARVLTQSREQRHKTRGGCSREDSPRVSLHPATSFRAVGARRPSCGKRLAPAHTCRRSSLFCPSSVV